MKKIKQINFDKENFTKNSTGFTLIELLAVIIILAIVALIATPIILNVIEDSRKSANMSQANILLSGAETYFASSMLAEGEFYIDGKTNVYPFIETTNEKPPLGNIKIKPNGDVFFALFLDDVCYSKDFEQSKIIANEEITNPDDCVPLSIVASTESKPVNGYYLGEINVTLTTNGDGLEYCVNECGTYTNVTEKTTSVTLNQEVSKLCFVATKNGVVEDTRQCITYNIDAVTPTITPKEGSANIKQNTNSEVSSYFDIIYGPTGGSVSCEPANTNTLPLGTSTVTCTATGNNGKSTSNTRAIIIEEPNYMVDGERFKFLISDNDNTITDVKFSSTISENYSFATTKFDLSRDKNNTVVGYLEDVDGKKILHIQANGPVVAHRDTGHSSCYESMFCDFPKLVSVEFNNSFDTSNVDSMEKLFAENPSLLKIDLSSLDTSNVTNMSYMFNETTSLKEINFGNIDVSKVQRMAAMFEKSGIETLDLSSFDTRSLKDMSSMFMQSSVTELDLSSFNTSNVVEMGGMFWAAKQLTKINFNNWDTGNVTNMAWMFRETHSLTELDLSNFNTSNVATMEGMFRGSYNLSSLNVSNFNTSKVKDMEYMFSTCNKLTELDLSSFSYDSISTYYMGGMFSSNDNLQTIYANNQADIDKLKATSSLPTGITFIIK